LLITMALWEQGLASPQAPLDHKMPLRKRRHFCFAHHNGLVGVWGSLPRRLHWITKSLRASGGLFVLFITMALAPANRLPSA
jgi:hypothetical protein